MAKMTTAMTIVTIEMAMIVTMTSPDSRVHARQEETLGMMLFPQRAAGVLVTIIITGIIVIVIMLVTINIMTKQYVYHDMMSLEISE